MPEGMRELSPVLSPYYQCEVGSDPEAAAVVDPAAVQTVYRNQKQLAAVALAVRPERSAVVGVGG